jgi:hypothetical protein
MVTPIFLESRLKTIGYLDLRDGFGRCFSGKHKVELERTYLALVVDSHPFYAQPRDLRKRRPKWSAHIAALK